MQDLHGQPRGLRDAGVRPHVHVRAVRQADERVPHMQAVRGQGHQDIQVIAASARCILARVI